MSPVETRLRCPANPVPWGNGTPPDFLGDFPEVSDSRLAGALAELYRPQAVIPGGAAAAFRIEAEVGSRVGGRSHRQKVMDRARQLRRLLRSRRLNRADREIASWVLLDLERALDGRTRCLETE